MCINFSYRKQGDGIVDEISEKSSKLSIEDLEKAVHDNVHEQIARITETMDHILLLNPRRKVPISGTENEAKKRPSGLSFAVGQEAPKPEDPETLSELEAFFLVFFTEKCG